MIKIIRWIFNKKTYLKLKTKKLIKIHIKMTFYIGMKPKNRNIFKAMII